MSTPPDNPKRAGSQLLVFMFTDLVNCAQWTRELGDDNYVRSVLNPHNAIFRNLLAEYDGAKEIKHTGDGFMATFASTSDAVECALRLHHALRSAEWKFGRPETRVGIHIGQAIVFAGAHEGDADLAGDAANMTARIMGLAEPQQTLLSKAAFDSAKQSGQVRSDWIDLFVSGSLAEIQWQEHGRYWVKGATEPLEICEVGLSGYSPLRPPADSEKAWRVHERVHQPYRFVLVAAGLVLIGLGLSQFLPMGDIEKLPGEVVVEAVENGKAAAAKVTAGETTSASAGKANPSTGEVPSTGTGSPADNKLSASPAATKEYKVILHELECKEPNDVDGEDQLVMAIEVDDKPFDPHLNYTSVSEGVLCVDLKRGDVWKFEIPITFEKQVVVSLRDLEGLPTIFKKLVITPQVIQNRLYELESTPFRLQKQNYILRWSSRE